MGSELIGRQLVDDEGRTLTVTGFASWSTTYMELSDGNGYLTVRSTGLLRAFRGWL